MKYLYMVLKHNIKCPKLTKVLCLKPSTDVASNLIAIDLRFDVRITCAGLQQKFQHAEHFTCDPLISQPIFMCDDVTLISIK